MKGYLNTGSTLLNLACSNMANGGFKLGKIANLIGDSSSGKTYLMLYSLAMAANDKAFDNYRLYLDDVEAADEFDKVKLFGKKAAERIESPYGDENRGSETAEEFYYTVDDLLQKKEPFIYVLDSMDALTSGASNAEFEENKQLHKKGKEAKGSFKMAKAKMNSEGLPQIASNIKCTDSFVCIISQTRDNIGMGFSPKTRSGGKALKFYSSYEMWMAVAKTLKKTIHGNDRKTGIESRIKLTKNKVTGTYAEVDVPILYNFGIDNVASCVDFMVDEGIWKGTTKKIVASDLGVELSRTDLIAHIEDNNLEGKLDDVVEKVWLDIIEKMTPKRKSRFN